MVKKKWYQKINFKVVFIVTAAISTLLASMHGYASDGGTDFLSGTEGDITSSFGSDSTIMTYIRIAEVMTSIVAYVKTKNPLIFVSVIILMIGIDVLFNVISS